MIDKLNARNRELFTLVFACNDVLRNCKMDFGRIAERVEDGSKRYNEAIGTLDHLISDIIQTLPPVQCNTIAKQIEVSEIRVATKSAIAKDESFWAIDRESLAVLTESAIANTCILCDGKKQKCPLREVLEEMPVEIEDRNLYVACREGELDI